MNCFQKKFYSKHVSLYDKGHYRQHNMLIKLLEMTLTSNDVIDIKCQVLSTRVLSTYNWDIVVILVSNSPERFAL